MKKIKLSLACLSISLLLVSCGSKGNENGANEPAAQDPQAFYNKITTHVENCDQSLFAFNDAIYADDKKDVQSTYDAMVKSFSTEKEQLSTVDIATGGEDQALSTKLKDAAIKYIDAHVEIGKKELLQLKNWSLEGVSDEDEKFLNVDIAATDKTSGVSSDYRKVKKEFREKYNLAKK